MLEKVLEGLKLLPWTDLKAQCKQEMKAKAELEMAYGNVEGAPQDEQPIGKDRETHWFKAFKEIFVQLLTDH